ncbi:MAG: ankyrin repeat domain-containing protein [Planctomycetota bacterium]|jgi:cytohesin
MNSKLSLTACWILAIVPSLCVLLFANNESETNPEAEQHFQKANELQILADYDAAIAEYQTVINLSPNSRFAQNAQYWIGQLYFESKRFDAALSAFQKLLDEYPESRTIPATNLMIERVQQAKKNKSLFEAIKKADVEKVKLLIAEGADIAAKWGDTSIIEKEETKKEEIASATPLYYAVDANNMDLVNLLVEAGADVNAGLWPPLCQAVDKNNTAIAEYLIDHGANVNYPKDWGPLHEAPYVNNNIEMVKLLIAKGADINAGPWPALDVSIWKGRKDIFDLLIQRGADVNAKDKRGQTPLYWAVDHDDFDSLKSLIAHGAKVDTKFWDGETALMSEASKGRIEAVKLLLEAGANISAKDDTGQTALHRMMDVSYRPSKDMTELLLARGADVNLKDKEGRTPLHLAAESADRDIVKFLLDKGAKVNAKDDESGFTPLHHAARFGKKNVAELLIAKGADINAKDKQGHTPLQVAVNHDYEVAELLINKGADSGVRTESGKTLLQLAQQRKQIESTAPDLIFDGEPNSSFGFQIVCGDVDGDGYDDILIGGHRYNNMRGRVYLFYGGPDMDTTADLILEGQNEGDWFGAWVVCGDIDNDGYEDIVISAGCYNERQGRAYLYWGSDRNSMDANPDKIFAGEAEEDSQFGAGNHAIYDIDNDGYNDIILGASHPGANRDRAGRAYLYYGNTKELMDTSADLIFTGEKPRDWFGYSISCGDVDNDGYGDIVIGGARQGRAYFYYGDSKSNMDAKADVVFEVESEHFGCGIVCVDQNKDGYDDIVIGAPGYNHWQGRAYLFYGNSKKSMDANPDMVFDGEVEGSYYLGPVQVVCGNIDGDNVNDLIIGANRFRQRTGRAYVYWGKDLSTPDPKPGRILTGENPNDTFGLGSACGDVNNDGFDDFVIGARRYKAGANQGRAYLYYGGPEK